MRIAAILLLWATTRVSYWLCEVCFRVARPLYTRYMLWWYLWLIWKYYGLLEGESAVLGHFVRGLQRSGIKVTLRGRPRPGNAFEETIWRALYLAGAVEKVAEER